jgi:osmotically-inducible protein OsmY
MKNVLTPVALIGVLLLGAGAAAAQRTQPSDNELARLVTQRLADKDIDGVGVVARSGIVTLRGTVSTLWIKQRAIEHAGKVDDVIAVTDELTIPRGESDDAIAFEVASRIRQYVLFTIFDDANVDVDEGVVTLTGRVTMPHKAEALVDLAAHIAGVQEVRSEILALPVSPFDDQIRYAVARQIYGDEVFARYAYRLNPPIHIIVEHGNVTLTGVVSSEVERRKAEMIARSTFSVMSVTNKLRLDSDVPPDGC